ALLGWSPEGEEEIFTLEELCRQFSLDRVAKNPAIFDLDKLNWINGYYIRQAPLDKIAAMAAPYLQEAGYLPPELSPEEEKKLLLIVAAVRYYRPNLASIVGHVDIICAEEIPVVDEEAKKVLHEEQVPRVMELFAAKIKAG